MKSTPELVKGMRKSFSINIPIILKKEYDQYVIYTPAFDLSSYGDTQAEAEKRFGEAVKIFVSSIEERGTINQVLKELGWEVVNKTWKPPMFRTESKQVEMPVMVG